MDKGVELTVTAEEVSRSGHIQSKATKYVTERKVVLKPTLSLEVTCLLSIRLASFRRQELYPGLITELGNLTCNEKGNAQREQPGGKIPMSRDRDGLTRSSAEISVMEVEQRD